MSLGNKETQHAKTRVLAVECPRVPSLCLPHYEDTASPHSGYHNLSHCLRVNTFPGACVSLKSLAKDCYVRPPSPALTTDPHCWYGRKTDEMGQWTERNIINQKLDKILKERGNKAITK